MKKSHSLQSLMNLRPQSTSLKKSTTNKQEVTKIQTNVKVRKEVYKQTSKQGIKKERESERKRK